MFWNLSRLTCQTTSTAHLHEFYHSKRHAPLAWAPGDLLVEISKYLETRADLLNFCLTSKYIYAIISATLYETVTLANIEQCTVTLNMLERREDIARHIRKLVVRPTGAKQSRVSASLLVSAAVRQLASTKNLDALVEFVWDGDEKPYHDDMWFALRAGCPQLKHIATTIGTMPLVLHSHLFDFTDLSGFALTLKSGFYETHIDMFLDEDNPACQQLWNMLLYNCPNLESLVIEGCSTIPTDVHALVEGRWPKLKRLGLGDVSIDWVSRTATPADKRPFIQFLEAHPKLTDLSLSKYTVQPMHLGSLDPAALQLTTFSGTIQQLQALPYLHPHLETVTFRDPIQTREVSAQTVAGLLLGLTQLKTLKISFILHSMYDSGNLLRSLITSCPSLKHLELKCCNRPSFQMETFSKTVRGFPKLRTLHLTIVKYPGDDTLSTGAARIAKHNPRLSEFSLTFIPPAYPLPVPYSLSYFPTLTSSQASGSFRLTTDQHGLPVSLRGHENSKVVWPWGLGSTHTQKKYVKDLRPISCVARRKPGWRGILDLITERSVAGEEMRMILFCGMLFVLAVWGFVANKGTRGVVTRVGLGPEVHRGVLSRGPTVARMLSTATARI